MINLKAQNGVFSAVVLLTVVLSLLPINLATDRLILPLSAVIVLLGVPHGSFDSLYARVIFRLSSFRGWVSFLALYLLLVCSVIFAWMLIPSVFFAAFLIISAFHFSEDLENESSWFARTFYGGSIIVLPFLLHSLEVTKIFSFIIPAPQAILFQNFLVPLSWAWFAGSLCSAVFCFKRNPINGLTVINVVLLSIVAQPLMAFTVYFCVMHSPRHILRTFEFGNQFSQKNILLLGLLPTIFVFLAYAFFGSAVQINNFEGQALRVVFVGLAALTVPHVLLLKKAASYNHQRANHLAQPKV